MKNGEFLSRTAAVSYSQSSCLHTQKPSSLPLPNFSVVVVQLHVTSRLCVNIKAAGAEVWSYAGASPPYTTQFPAIENHIVLIEILYF